MKFAFADPPYLGCGKLYAAHHPDALAWDDLATHARLIQRLTSEFADGWVMSLSSPSLQAILALCPENVRVGSWVKPFASFKPNVPVAYAWEPVIFSGGRRRGRDADTVRDWVAESITLQKGLTGAKPPAFCRWVLDLLGFDPLADEVEDLFPGTGVMGRVVSGLREGAATSQMTLEVT